MNFAKNYAFGYHLAFNKENDSSESRKDMYLKTKKFLNDLIERGVFPN